MIRLLLADDDDCFVAALTVLLESDGRFEILGRARDGREAVELASTRTPDVVLMDIEMPLMDGIEATRCICNGGSTAAVIALSGTEYSERALAIRDAGAADYIQKSRYADGLLDAIVALSANNGSHSRASAPTTSTVDALRAQAAQTPVAANQAPVRNPRQAADRDAANCRSTKRPRTTTRGD